MKENKINLHKNIFNSDSEFEHLDAFDLGYGLERNYNNPFDEFSSMHDKYDLGFDTGRAAK